MQLKPDPLTTGIDSSLLVEVETGRISEISETMLFFAFELFSLCFCCSNLDRKGLKVALDWRFLQGKEDLRILRNRSHNVLALPSLRWWSALSLHDRKQLDFRSHCSFLQAVPRMLNVNLLRMTSSLTSHNTKRIDYETSTGRKLLNI